MTALRFLLLMGSMFVPAAAAGHGERAHVTLADNLSCRSAEGSPAHVPAFGLDDKSILPIGPAISIDDDQSESEDGLQSALVCYLTRTRIAPTAFPCSLINCAHLAIHFSIGRIPLRC
jgi:hypothetical protein